MALGPIEKKSGGSVKMTDPSSSNSEPLTRPNPDRWTYFPIQHHDIHAMMKKQASCMWFPEEIDLEDDVQQWRALDEDTRKYLQHVLAFFAASDGLINQNLMQQFMQEMQWSEVLGFYAYQACIEQVHSETYSLFIDRLLTGEEKAKAFHALEHYPCIKAKADWAVQYTNDALPLATRLAGFALVEGLFFSASFCAIFYLKCVKGIMPGLGQANEFISRDESLHYSFAVLLYTKYVKHKMPVEDMRAMIRSAVDTEKMFVQESLPVSLIGLSAESMCEYVEHVANRICVAFGIPKIYQNAKMPFDWMHSISLGAPKSNFFEKRETGYSKFNVGKGKKKTTPKTLTFDADF